MYEIVKYRYRFNSRVHPSSGWVTKSLSTFRYIFKRLPERVIGIDVRICKQISGASLADARYKVVDAWDWLRFGLFPSVDQRLEELAKKNPEKYHRSSNGIWVRRQDLIPN